MSEEPRPKSLRPLYRKVFGTPEGKKVLRDMARRANVMAAVSPHAVAPHVVHYAEGMRELFWYVFGQVHDTEIDVQSRSVKRFDNLSTELESLRKIDV